MSAVQGDRGIPTLKSQAGFSGKARVLLIVVVVLVFAGIIGWVIFTQAKQNSEADAASAEQQEKQNQESALPSDSAPLPDDLKTAIAEPAPPQVEPDAADMADSAQAQPSRGSELPPPPMNGMASAGGGPTYSSNASANPNLTPEEQAAADEAARRQRSPVLAYNGEDAQGGAARGAPQEPAAKQTSEEDAYMEAVTAALQASQGGQNGGAGGSGQKDDSLAGQLKSDTFEPALATRIPDPNFTMPQGTIARCTLRTAFNSQLSGFASCILTDPVYSSNGRFVLWEAGSEVTGTYQTGQLRPGMKRAFVLWTRVRTPNGVVINIDSPATDGMGRAGFTGDVNNHFFQRFGAAMLVSLVDDVAGYAVAKQRGSSGDQTNISFGSTAESSRDAASIIVENSIGIPPTLSADAGAIVNLFVARDLYFGNVYGFRPKPATGARR